MFNINIYIILFYEQLYYKTITYLINDEYDLNKQVFVV